MSPDAARIGVITFSDTAERRFDLKTYSRKEDVMHNINYLPYKRGRTNIADAISLAKDSFSPTFGGRNNVNKFIILVTDGHSNVNSEQTLPVAIEARVANIYMVVVGIESQPTLEMKGIASDPDSEYLFTLSRYDQLLTTFPRLANAVCDGA